MSAVVPFIPLIAAGVGAAGSIISAKMSGNAQNKIAADASRSLAKPPTILDPAQQKPRKPILYGTGPFGDVTSPTLNRNKLLGN